MLDNRIDGSEHANTIYGHGGNDRLNGGASFDHLIGGEGDDRIMGGLELDYIETGPGSDVIVYRSVLDAGNFIVWDIEWIADWDAMDRIDLSAIDANSEIAGNQAFEFAGGYYGEPAPFTGAGTLTIGGFGGELYVMAHTDSDGSVDFLIGLWSAAGEAGLTADMIIM